MEKPRKSANTEKSNVEWFTEGYSDEFQPAAIVRSVLRNERPRLAPAASSERTEGRPTKEQKIIARLDEKNRQKAALRKELESKSVTYA